MKINHSFQINSLLKMIPPPHTHTHTHFLENYFAEVKIKKLKTITNHFFENCFLSAMTPYIDSRVGRSLSIYGTECQIWKTFTTMFTAIDPNKDISKTKQVHMK